MRLSRIRCAALLLLFAACGPEPSEPVSSASNQSFPLDLEEPLPGSDSASHMYQCWLGGGVTVARSENLGAHDLPRLETSAGEVRYADIALPDGDNARAVAVRFYIKAQDGENSPSSDGARARGAESHPVEIVVARSTQSIDRSLRLLRWVLVATWVISMLTCAGIMSWLVRRGLSPLNKLSRQIHTYDQDQLGDAFEIPGAAEELEPVVRQLNGFVDRIREAFELDGVPIKLITKGRSRD